MLEYFTITYQNNNFLWKCLNDQCSSIFAVTNDEFISQKVIYVMFCLGNILFIN